MIPTPFLAECFTCVPIVLSGSCLIALKKPSQGYRKPSRPDQVSRGLPTTEACAEMEVIDEKPAATKQERHNPLLPKGLDNGGDVECAGSILRTTQLADSDWEHMLLNAPLSQIEARPSAECDNESDLSVVSVVHSHEPEDQRAEHSVREGEGHLPAESGSESDLSLWHFHESEGQRAALSLHEGGGHPPAESGNEAKLSLGRPHKSEDRRAAPSLHEVEGRALADSDNESERSLRHLQEFEDRRTAPILHNGEGGPPAESDNESELSLGHPHESNAQRADSLFKSEDLFSWPESMRTARVVRKEQVWQKENLIENLALHARKQDGVAALIDKLASVYGSPQEAFQRLDSAGKGRISMCEFDCQLRHGMLINYVELTGMRLQPLFGKLDVRKCRTITAHDLANVCPEIWQAHYMQDKWSEFYSQRGHDPLTAQAVALIAKGGG